MASRKTIQDSNDESDDLGANLPQDCPLKEQATERNSFDLEEGPPSTKPQQASVEGSIGSTEQLQKQIQDASRNLLTQTTPSIDTSGGMTTSLSHLLQTPTLTKTKRRQTTMSGKKAKTYGSKTTLDDLVLRDSDWMGDTDKKETKRRLLNPEISIKVKRRKDNDGIVKHHSLVSGNDATQDLHPFIFVADNIIQPTVVSDENALISTASNTKSSSLAKEGHDLPPTAGNRKSSNLAKEDDHLSSIASNRNYTGLTREEDEAIALALTELPSPIPTEKATQFQSEDFPTQKATQFRSPEVSMRYDPQSQSRFQYQDVVGDQDELALDIPAHLPDNAKATTTKTNKKRIMEAATHDAAEVDPSHDEPSSTTIKSKKKRKATDWAKDTAHSDHDGDLPIENYEPWPCKSRVNPAVDEFVENLDWSKRTESLLKPKSKIKRRKTTGNALLRREEVQNEEDLFESETVPVTKNTVKEDSPSADDKIILKGSETTEQRSISTISVNISKGKSNAEEFTAPKKKRGRPKKSDVTVTEDLPKQKKGRRKGTTDTDAASVVDSPAPAKNDDEQLFVPEDESLVKNKHILTDSKDGGNTAKQSLPKLAASNAPVETKEATPAFHAPPLKENTPLQTPTKQTGEGGVKGHSPLNSGKIAYRVGLSKRARIPPLLRMIKK